MSAHVHDDDACCVVSVVAPGQVLRLEGRLDVRDAADIRLAIAGAVEVGSGELVLDVSALSAVDATGLGVLLEAHRAATRANRTLVLRDVPESLGRLLFVSRLHRVLHQSSSVA